MIGRKLGLFLSINKKIGKNVKIIDHLISKSFERSVFNQLYEILNSNSLLSKHQFGFRPKNSTLAALTKICDAWYENIDNGDLEII